MPVECHEAPFAELGRFFLQEKGKIFIQYDDLVLQITRSPCPDVAMVRFRGRFACTPSANAFRAVTLEPKEHAKRTAAMERELVKTGPYDAPKTPVYSCPQSIPDLSLPNLYTTRSGSGRTRSYFIPSISQFYASSDGFYAKSLDKLHK